MFASLIKKVTFVCPNCKTSVSFSVLPGSEEVTMLKAAVSKFSCPKCEANLSANATLTVQKIHEYNNSLSYLDEMLSHTNAILN